MLGGCVALVEEVEHLAGVELSAAADPVAATGLGGGLEVVLGSFGDLVLAALRVGEAKVGHVKAGFDEVARFFRVVEDGVVEGDGSGSIAGVLSQVGDLETEEIVAGDTGRRGPSGRRLLHGNGRRDAGRARGAVRDSMGVTTP